MSIYRRIEYQYETLEEAEKDYYKLYNAFVNEKPLYKLDSVDYDNLTVSGTTFYFISTQEENGAYRFIDFIEDESFDYNFKTKEELNDYVIENIYDEEKVFYIDSLCTLGNYITFDNNALSITEHSTMNNFLNEFFDTYNIDVFIISTCFAFGATVISVILYFRKKK